MNLKFKHKGETITARVVSAPSQIDEIIILFPDSHLGELGFSILLTKVDNEWMAESYLLEKHPGTVFNILEQVHLLESDILKSH